MSKKIRTTVLAFGAGAMALSAIPAQAQFRGMFRDAQRGAQAAEGCEKGSTGDTARGVIGGLLGGAAGRTARRAGLGQFVPISEFTDQLSAEIACKLDEQEQKQAADATLEATRGAGEDGSEGPPVGQTSSWTSDSRDDVSGTSTVTAREASSGSDDCIMVTDVIIVEGEETRAEKRMCRPVGSARYSIVA
jgi:surface antigen